jgi:hypothetical protein
MLALAQWLEHTSVSQEIQKALWLIRLLQTTHIIAIAMALSSVLMIELRILGFGKSLTITQTSARYAPWLWTGLIVLALTGLALIIGEPRRALPNPAFQIKMLLLAFTLAVAGIFQASLQRSTAFWEGRSLGRRLMGGFAVIVFFLWCAIAIAGRWIAYVHTT